MTGREFPATPACLPGYRREHPPGSYAFVVPDAGARVDGVLLDDVDAISLARLDDYEDEGRLYVRRAVHVEVDGHPVACDVYVGAGITRR